VGANHFAWEMASFEDLQTMVCHLKAKGVEILRVRENTYSVGVYFNDPDGNGLEVYDESLGDPDGPGKANMPGGSWCEMVALA
jgi:catechol-2,3-dioxygenase